MAAPPNVVTITSSPAATQKLPSSSHRLPTVSGSDALLELQNTGPERISTTLGALDGLLSGAATSGKGGLERGKTSELWGPNGAGKTALLLQIATRELCHGNKVVWIDGASPISTSRLDTALECQARGLSGITATFEDLGKYKQNLILHRMTSLSPLLALVLHPRPEFPPPGTTLLVIKGLNTLVDLDYPRVLFASSGKTPQQKWQAGRRYAVLGALITGLNKLAVLSNLKVSVTTGCASRMRTDSGLGSALIPGLGGAEWDGGVWNRLAVFRDFGCRFVGVQKSQGRTLISREEVGETGEVVGFEIEHDGTIRQRGPAGGTATEKSLNQVVRSPTKPRKRVFDEVADSEGEDADEYGWAETDEDVFAADTAGDEAAEQPAADSAVA